LSTVASHFKANLEKSRKSNLSMTKSAAVLNQCKNISIQGDGDSDNVENRQLSSSKTKAHHQQSEEMIDFNVILEQ